MTGRVAALYAAFQSGERWPQSRRLAGVLGRYALSALGSVSVAAAHFAAALILLHALSPAAFGLLSFVLVIVPFSLSASGALVSAPLAMALNRAGGMIGGELATYMKANLVFSAIAGVCVFGLLMLSGAGFEISLPLGAYGAAMCVRWFARAYAYCTHRPVRAVASDLVYSVLLIAALSGLTVFGLLSERAAALALLASALASFASFGLEYAGRQVRALFAGSLAGYGTIWRELTRWSLLGVVTTELTMNAHAYLVTFISGPKAFALLAVGSLFMRPAVLAMTALPDVERPIMARDIANGKIASALRSVKEFRTAAAAIWLGTIVLAAIVWIWFPKLLLRADYNAGEVLMVIALSAAIMFIRGWRTAESVLLQAAGEFRSLAGPSVRASIVSLSATAILLLLFGPVASLCGILAGDVVMAANLKSVMRKWTRQHG